MSKRPAGGRITVRLDEETWELLEARAEAAGLSLGETVRLAIHRLGTKPPTRAERERIGSKPGNPAGWSQVHEARERKTEGE